MDTITISTKEYRRLLATKRTLYSISEKKRKSFADTAFGVLKESFRESIVSSIRNEAEKIMAMSATEGYCIDSDILIDYLRGMENARTFLREAHKETTLYISVVSIVELYAGKATKDDDTRTRIERFLQAFEVIPLDTWLAQTAGALRRDYGHPFADMIVAATAHEYNLRLVTRNIKHFELLHEGAGLHVIKPY